ncbi:FAD-binding oxidoreductase [Paramagnetospirillum kuznetsovii]|uniref:FAD-binding oxidoreductase n=1 Tax=Paramagnetospirillum kuznetsovii TaxID=2053833 RepID=A0A364NVQ4_9PROT|nr:FAD-binding oxidoreductase [Paramagnetospirillum kuznetsovii]RAU21133.1 FAD-binding oxidoreductase [Paramagnetospirillum kuznetsovii]
MTNASLDLSSLPKAELTDDGGKPLTASLCVTSHIAAAVAAAVGQNWAVMPAGGLTSAISSYDYKPEDVAGFVGVVAIRPKGALMAETVDAATPLEDLKSHQVAIQADQGLVSAGAGLTFTQVNAALAEAVGPTARVLVDLTSIGSAFVGGVVATGGMGPLRLLPSATLDAVCLADGGAPKILRGDDIAQVEGMQGWTGMVCAARFRFYLVPASEFGLVLPVQGSDVDTVAGLLKYLRPWTQVALPEPGALIAGEGGETVLNGIELVSRDSLETFIAHAEEPARSKAEGLLQSCEYAGADMLACLTGWSELSIDDVLMSLLDPETETIGGVGIDFGVGFSSGAEMETFRAIREGAPDLARTKARVVPPGKLKPWSTSTDINMVLPADSSAIVSVLEAYADYRGAIRALRKELAGAVEVELSAYGHLSPAGIDPHHRVTLFAPEGADAALAGARQAVAANKRTLIHDLLFAARSHDSQVTGGEKGAPSLVEIARAAGGESRLPEALKARFQAARAAVMAAPAQFSFRAPAELRSE